MSGKRRIVSLVPSLSATVCDLGLKDELVGCTNFCIEPRDLHRSAALVGGTKDPDLERIRQLQPSHILANEEENPRDPILDLSQSIPTLVTFPKGPEDVPQMLRDLGQFLCCEASAELWASRLEKLLRQAPRQNPLRFLYLIWQNPYMLAGPDSYISRTLERLGWTNAYEGPERYPSMDVKGLAACGADIVLLSSEPYPFRKRDAAKLREQWLAAPRLCRIDGQMLSWFGTRTLSALETLSQDKERWLKDFS